MSSTIGDPERTRPRGDDRTVRPVVFPPLLFLSALLGGLALGQVVPIPIFERGWVGHAIGWPVFLAGAVLARSAERTMRRAEVDPRFRPVPTMVTSGLFARTRNPLYVTVSLVYAGLAIVCNTWWPLLLYPGVFGLLHFGVVLREERYLEERFGDAYREYRRRVRRWL